MNKCLFIGTIVKDIELSKSKNGTDYLRNTIAINKTIKNKLGEFETETLFLDFIMFSFNAVNANRILEKGYKIFIEGELKGNEYEDKEGKKVKSFSLNVEKFELLKAPKQKNNTQNDSYVPSNSNSKSEFADYENEEIPF